MTACFQTKSWAYCQPYQICFILPEWLRCPCLGANTGIGAHLDRQHALTGGAPLLVSPQSQALSVRRFLPYSQRSCSIAFSRTLLVSMRSQLPADTQLNLEWKFDS